MITPVPYQTNLLEFLETVAAKSAHKTALAGGKFKRDYGNVFYFTQNRVRANQLNSLLAQEVAQTDEKTIIPPAVLPYTAGFIRLAALAKFGYVDSLNVCRYSDEWFSLFLYEVAGEAVPEDFFKDEFGLADNKRANLAKDFRTFIRDAVLHLKTNKIDEAAANGNTTEQLFVKAYRAYRKEEQQFPNTENQFIHPLQAYEDLYARVQKGNTGLKKVIIVENKEMLEPLFREILEKLDCPVYAVEDKKVEDTAYTQHTDLYHFMTPLDEAEFVGWKIKKLLTQKVPATDIGVVCGDAGCKEVLESVFKRMELDGEQTLPLAANGYYRLVKMLFSLIYREEGASFSAEDLLADDKSKFKLGKSFYPFYKMLTQKGLKTQLYPADGLLQSIDEFVRSAQYQDESYAKDKERLLSLKALLEMQNPSVSQIAEKALNDRKDKPLINDILAALYELDENLKAEINSERMADKESFFKKAHALFGVLDGRELNTPRPALALEKAPAPEDEADEEPRYSFSVVGPEPAQTLRVKHLFLCGFNANADKIGLLCYPNALAEKLELPTLRDKKMRVAQSVAYALNYAEEATVTYGYLSLEGKENGQAVLIQLLGQVLPEKNQHLGEDNHLLKSHELVKDMPDRSWTGAQKADRQEKHLQEFAENLFAGAKTCGDLLNQILKPNENGVRSIAAKQFADFIICPSRFFFALMAKYSGMDLTDAEGIQRMSRGTFWHAVFENAAKEADFYGKGEAKINGILESVLAQMLKQEDISKFTVEDEPSFVAQAKEGVLPLFARNEAARQEKFGLSGYEVEKKFTCPLPSCDFVITGKVDRKDKGTENTIFFWDYKTGDPKAAPLQFYSGKKIKKLEKDANALQLAIYMHCFAKQCAAEGQTPPPLCAGNIFINGKDNLSPQSYDETLATLLDAQIESFVQYLGNSVLSLPKENKLEASVGGKCRYCDFKTVCQLISKRAGGKND